MIEHAIDQDGRIQWASIVPPLSDEEHAALRQVLREWKSQPMVLEPYRPVQIVDLRPPRFEPELEDTP